MFCILTVVMILQVNVLQFTKLYTQKSVNFTISKLHINKSDCRKKKDMATARATSCGHLSQSSHFWHLVATLSGPVILMFLQLCPRLSLRSCTWPVAYVKAFLPHTTDVLPAAPSYLTVIFFSAKTELGGFLFLVDYFFMVLSEEFLGSLDIMALSPLCTCYQGA